jgi:hypothetical protein
MLRTRLKVENSKYQIQYVLVPYLKLLLTEADLQSILQTTFLDASLAVIQALFKRLLVKMDFWGILDSKLV